MPRSMKIALSFLVGVLVVVFAFTAGVLVSGFMPPELGPDFQAIQDAWQVITEDYVDKDNLDTGELSQAAIEAMMGLIDDPYSSYLDSAAYQASLSQLEGKFEGIGAEVTLVDEEVVIVAPFAGSPAENAGILPGDRITAINMEPTTGMSLMDVVLKVRGPKGTPVTLEVFRPDTGQTLEMTVVRDEVYSRSVEMEMVSGYAHISIGQFAENTNDEMGDVLVQVEQSGAEGIILDLRYNPGGLVDSVVDVASRFLSEGVVFTVQFSDGQQEVYSVNQQDETTDLPMIVLVNGFSASGAEVISGAFQDYGRAVIAGSTTFGKGSVNILTQIGSDQGLYITIARWLTPNGNMIEGNGIEPDIPLDLSGDDLVDWAVGYFEAS